MGSKLSQMLKFNELEAITNWSYWPFTCCMLTVNVRLSVLKIFKLKCFTSYLWKDLHCFSSALCLTPVSVKQCRTGLIFSVSSGAILESLQGWFILFWNRSLRGVKWTTHYSLVIPSPSPLSAGGPWPMKVKVQWDLSYLQAFTEFFVSCLTWGSGKSRKITCGFCTLLGVRTGQFTTRASGSR